MLSSTPITFTPDAFYQGLLFFFFGVVAAVIYTVYHKTVIGKFVSAMIEAGAVGEENAKTLEALGFDNNKIIKSALKHNVTLSRKINNNHNGYYIADIYGEEMKKRYDSSMINLKELILTVVILLAIFIALWVSIPAIVKLLNNLSYNR